MGLVGFSDNKYNKYEEIKRATLFLKGFCKDIYITGYENIESVACLVSRSSERKTVTLAVCGWNFHLWSPYELTCSHCYRIILVKQKFLLDYLLHS